MLNGESLNLEIKENVNLRDLTTSDIYTLLLQSGYLTYEEKKEIKRYKLPNKEVRDFVKILIREVDEGTGLTDIEIFVDNSNWKGLEKEIRRYIFNSLSYYDPPEMGKYREKFYHGVLIGMLVHLKKWKVTSNREKGLGRPDLVLTKKEKEIVIELKAGEKETDTLEDLIESAEFQINNKKYGENAEKIAMAFIGKEFAMKILN